MRSIPAFIEVDVKSLTVLILRQFSARIVGSFYWVFLTFNEEIMNTRVFFAVFKRNFIGYFANPTGYVFICVFVLLSSIAAFLPYEFFSANLANLDQLNQWFPLIMFVFIPAITMGIWADERRQGTDELLLTIPAGDCDIVCGKYFSAVAIYTVSLLFSCACNYAILNYLGNPDKGLFVCTYIGYWFTGIAMLAIGMVASFLTANLTIAYIIGAIFCVPLVAFHWADAAPIGRDFAAFVKQFSINSQFDTFGRGIVGFASIVYFLAIVAVMLYLCMVLIGKRHWSASQQFVGGFHYTVRAVSLTVIGFALVMILGRFDLRADLTAEKLSSLSPLTVQLIQKIDPEHPVVIEAYLSPEVPDTFIQTRMNIISVLKEFESKSNGKISVRFHEIRPYTADAIRASERYGITPREVWYDAQGIRNNANIFLGVAFRCGLQSLTLPFINRGLSPEYELIHALCSVTDPQKKRVGVLKTDVPIFGQFSMQTFSQSPDMRIVEELRKRYNVVEVDPAQPLTERYDALIAVQPSTLGPQEMQNFIMAIQSGQPTVIFEDAFPINFGGIGGTSEPRRPRNQNPFMQQQQMQPKGEIGMLWRFLGVDFDGGNSVWQAYNPIRKLRTLPQGFVFLDNAIDEDAKNMVSPFDRESPITKNLQYLMLPFPGSMRKSSQSRFEYKPLVWTVQKPSGTTSVANARAAMQQVSMESIDEVLNRMNTITNGPKEIAAQVTGEYTLPAHMVEEGEPQPVKINVVLVADIDMLHDQVFMMQEQGSPPGMGINLDFENVSFILNAIDHVAGDERFLAIRTRRPTHRTLQRIDKATDEMWQQTAEKREVYKKEMEKQIGEEQDKLESRLEQIRKEMTQKGLSQEEVLARVNAVSVATIKNMAMKNESLRQEVNTKEEEAKAKMNDYIQMIQGKYKFYAVALPPIPPLLIGLLVFITRRVREYEGVPKTRIRK